MSIHFLLSVNLSIVFILIVIEYGLIVNMAVGKVPNLILILIAFPIHLILNSCLFTLVAVVFVLLYSFCS